MSVRTAPDQVRGSATSAAWISLTIVSLGLFLAVLSTTIVSVALPTLGRDLHAGASGLEWVVDAYVVVYASLLAAGGALGDRLGRKGLFLTGVALFGIGSLFAGLAPSIPVLLAGRVVQGVGPALLVPGSLTIIRTVFTNQRRRAMAIGMWSTSSGLALAVGPPLGGLLVTGAGWRAVFWINAPLAALLLAGGARFLPRIAHNATRARFDWPAAILITAAVALLAFGVIDGQDRGWGNPSVLAVFLGGAVALAAFVAVERRWAAPMIDVSLFRSYRFSVANAAAFVVFFAFVGVIVYLSAYFQQVQGHSAIHAGVDVVAIGVAYALATIVSGRMVGPYGERWLMFAGLVVAGGATVGLLRLEPDTGIGAIWWNFALLGAGIGLCGTPMSTVAMSAVDTDRAGMASAVVNAMRQIGQVFGVAVLGALVYAQLPGGSGTQRSLGPAQQKLFVTGLHHALLVCAVALLVAAVPVAIHFTDRAGERTKEEVEMTDQARDFEQFMNTRDKAATAYVNGDPDPVDALATDTAPASFFGPDAGAVSEPAAIRQAYRSGAQLFASGGNSRLEVLDARASGNIGYWCGIQHATVHLAGEDSTVEMLLRITEIFRREHGEWKLVHRHADPLKQSE